MLSVHLIKYFRVYIYLSCCCCYWCCQETATTSDYGTLYKTQKASNKLQCLYNILYHCYCSYCCCCCCCCCCCTVATLRNYNINDATIRKIQASSLLVQATTSTDKRIPVLYIQRENRPISYFLLQNSLVVVVVRR